jgi:hypothetical protein
MFMRVLILDGGECAAIPNQPSNPLSGYFRRLPACF